MKFTGTGTLPVTPSGVQTVDGLASITLYPNQVVGLVSDGTNLKSSISQGYGPSASVAAPGTVTLASADVAADAPSAAKPLSSIEDLKRAYAAAMAF